jgi:hypothetical protein
VVIEESITNAPLDTCWTDTMNLALHIIWVCILCVALLQTDDGFLISSCMRRAPFLLVVLLGVEPWGSGTVSSLVSAMTQMFRTFDPFEKQRVSSHIPDARCKSGTTRPNEMIVDTVTRTWKAQKDRRWTRAWPLTSLNSFSLSLHALPPTL